LRQLQQYYYSAEDITLNWNKYGNYCWVPTRDNERVGLEFVHVSKHDSDIITQIENFSFFKPNAEKNPPDVVLSLEEWAARILNPSIVSVHKKAIESDSDTKKRLQRASKPKQFKLSTTNFVKNSPTSKKTNSPSKKKTCTNTSDDKDIVTPTSTETLQTQTDSTHDLYTTSNEFHSMAGWRLD
jgi:hypothetical protein